MSRMKQTSFFNFFPTKAEEESSSSSNGEAVSSSQVPIRKVGPRTRTVNYMGRTVTNMDNWEFTKVLTASDVDFQWRLALPQGVMLNNILSHLSRGGANVLEGNEENIIIKDIDTDTYHEEMVIFKDPRIKIVLLKGHWRNAFVNRRNLKAGYFIGLRWNDAENCFEFSVLGTN